MTIDKQSLREAAEKALPAMKRLLMMPNDELFDEALLNVDGDVDAANAFNLLSGPETVLALLDELEAAEKTSAARLEAIDRTHKMFQRERDRADAAEKRIAEQQSAIIAPGIMRCAGCGFVLTKNNINMTAGTITAGDSKTEPCPNGCGPLWPVTWKEQALQMRDDSEQWFLELQDAKNRIAELEARTVKLPEALVPAIHNSGEPFMRPDPFGLYLNLDDVLKALRAAGIGKGE
ncbi:ead/Ea22-like family protein [Citrobacter koseri]|uniref:ead/Ea22-like family protein n=1 Tax=Citrobacter koseri TaxID=545 RepID=UPI00254E9FE4|nr:ead/Ea22-like family protein [Citrobacter koseri]MEC5643578.1 ead/Ea22-like family protein [Citrobacter koseri]